MLAPEKRQAARKNRPRALYQSLDLIDASRVQVAQQSAKRGHQKEQQNVTRQNQARLHDQVGGGGGFQGMANKKRRRFDLKET